MLSAARRGGFTLIEMIVVIAVIAVLAAVVTPMVFQNVGDARVTATAAQIDILSLALDAYRLDNDYYPTTGQGLEALVSRPSGDQSARNWRGPYLRKGVPLDGWKRPFAYVSPGQANPSGFDLLSLGRDGRPGGVGEDADLKSWESRAQ